MALIGPMKYLTIGNKTYEIESGDSDIYWLEYGSTVDWSEVEAAYNANKQIICYESQDNTYSYYYLVTLGFTENNGDITASLSFMEVNSLYQNMAYWMYSYGQGSWYKETYSLSTMKTYFLTCFTDASTQIKTASSPGFSLSNGTIVGILFTTGNTADAPQLNINSTGAKPIYVGGSVTNGTTNVLKWSANTLLYFVYYAANYYYISSVSAGTVEPSRGANTWYGTSTTAAATQAKTSTINNFVLTKGSLASIRFTYANTYTSAKITLNINSTGAKDVYYNGTVTSSTNTLLWNAGEVLTFMYDGTGYQYIGKSIQKVSQLTNDSGFTTNTGTVTSVGISNATNGGLTISGSPVTGSGSITIGHSNVLTSAQTTQAVYPIKIDKNGHISSYGSAVTITDEKVATSACEVLAVGSYYYPILGTDTTSATTKYYDSTGLRYGGGGINALLILGDASNAKYGSVRLYNSSGGYTNLVGSGTSSTNNLVYLPSTGGTLALTSNIPTVPTITLNGSTTTSPSFYAPTGTGTSNYFLKSSGSGAPTWSQPIKYGTSLPASGDFTGQVFILTE